MNLFNQLKTALAPTETAERDPEHAQRIAAAVLMLEIAHADHVHADVEYQTIRTELENGFALDAAGADELLEAARPQSDDNVSLYTYLKTLNSGLNATEKREVIEMLWRVAYADREIAADEEALLRRLADMLYLPHSEFIRAKLAVLGD
ncbi:TerB family tellurite resistance protein [Salinisphaera sp. USBA-960]|uniref:tellurite resistance TerB family protein n=1 Tax=Salinisphaera orenii TaxID=856731 RepID=UPI000DBE7C27|nr:TerB family tellurite resistance protein [Salifodinibacter halophilus]NNC26958.1 TerB family tellurite resistance protein [Salifodinibacter halophilus]